MAQSHVVHGLLQVTALHGHRGAQQRRVDAARADSQHADVLARVVDRHLAGQRQGRALAGGIRRDQRRRLQTLHAGDVDDRPAAAAAHVRDGVLGGQEVALHVDRHDLVPHLLGRVLRGLVGRGWLDAHVVAQHVDGAEGGDRLRHRGPAAGVGGQVGLKEHRGAAGRGDPVDPCRARAGIAVDHQHPGAGRGRRVGDGAADAERAAGDHERLAFERQRSVLHDKPPSYHRHRQ